MGKETRSAPALQNAKGRKTRTCSVPKLLFLVGLDRSLLHTHTHTPTRVGFKGKKVQSFAADDDDDVDDGQRTKINQRRQQAVTDYSFFFLFVPRKNTSWSNFLSPFFHHFFFLDNTFTSLTQSQSSLNTYERDIARQRVETEIVALPGKGKLKKYENKNWSIVGADRTQSHVVST